ncbi:MAG: DUF309 domain-containing protein [Chloroflexi bacterium]|nr:DUF309 domain-containing protein [Chloroflexota bacterium]
MQAPTIIFASRSNAFDALVNNGSQYNNIELSEAQQFVDVLIERRGALAFIDGALADWRRLILAAKNNAASRRVPICFASDDNLARAEALACGADLALGWAELSSRFSQIVQGLARVADPETRKRLECECRQALPQLARRGLQAFNRGDFYHQHDLFEEQWVKTTGPVRDLYRAILQVGVAYYQIERGNYRGALKMLQRSVQWLHPLPDCCQGVDVEELRRDSYALRAELQRLGPEGLGDLDRRLLKPIRWAPPQRAKT